MNLILPGTSPLVPLEPTQAPFPAVVSGQLHFVCGIVEEAS